MNDARDATCMWLNLRVRVERPSSKCDGHLATGRLFEGDELLPKRMCLFLFHALYPYFVTIQHGGWFTWVPPGGTVIAQCANPDGAVELEIGREMRAGTPTVFARVRQVRGLCPQGYAAGNALELRLEDFPFCPKALGAFIPYLAIVARGGDLPWKDDQGRFVLRCPDVECDGMFAVERAG